MFKVFLWFKYYKERKKGNMVVEKLHSGQGYYYLQHIMRYVDIWCDALRTQNFWGNLIKICLFILIMRKCQTIQTWGSWYETTNQGPSNLSRLWKTIKTKGITKKVMWNFWILNQKKMIITGGNKTNESLQFT